MKWLVSNWNELISVPWNFATLAVVAVLCGAILGIEPDKKEKPVGFRTLTLVSLGSAVFTMMSVAVDPEHGDPTRIAAQVVTGIGFLGAGVILRGRFGVTGLTSAATIWIMAATGMVIGFGYGGAGIFLSILVLTVIRLIAALGRQYVGPCDYGTCVVRFASSGGKTAILLEEFSTNTTWQHVIASLPSKKMEMQSCDSIIALSTEITARSLCVSPNFPR